MDTNAELANEKVYTNKGLWSVNQIPEETERIRTDSLNIKHIMEKRNANKTDADKTSEKIGLFRKWLVVPITIFYFGAYVTAFLTLSQYVYVKIQKDKFPNVTFNSSIPVCNANESDPKYKIQTEVQQESAQWMTYLALASGVPGFFSDLILGSYTDRFGRKFLFFLPCIGAFVHLAVNTIGIYTEFSLYWFIPAAIFDGLTGQIFGLLLVTFSYTADITQPGKERSLGIVLIELAIGIGFAGFSFSTGYFIQSLGFLWPMFSCAVFLATTTVLVILLPETYTKEKRKHTSSPWENLTNAFKLYIGKDNSGKRWMYNILILTFALTTFPVLGRANVDTLFQLNDPFCWDPKHVSWFVALRSGTQQVVGMTLVKPLQSILSDEIIAVLGSLSFMASFTLEGLAKTDALLYTFKRTVRISVPDYFPNLHSETIDPPVLSVLCLFSAAAVGCLGMLTVPMLRAIMSKLTSAEKQGAVFASIGCIETLVNVAGTVIANTVYDNTINFFKGFVFFVFVLCNLLCCVLMIIFKVKSVRGNHYQTLEIQD